MAFFSVSGNSAKDRSPGLAGWLLARLRRGPRPRPRLALIERISLSPRQTLSLVEADGRRFLVATSADGSPSFCALHGRAPASGPSSGPAPQRRVSW